jgi:hypothetical protein
MYSTTNQAWPYGQHQQQQHQHQPQMYNSFQNTFYSAQGFDGYSDHHHSPSHQDNSDASPTGSSSPMSLPSASHHFSTTSSELGSSTASPVGAGAPGGGPNGGNGDATLPGGIPMHMSGFPVYDAANSSLFNAGVVGYYLASDELADSPGGSANSGGEESFRGESPGPGATARGMVSGAGGGLGHPWQAPGMPKRDLAPLHTLKRAHPYKRDPVDDHTLRRLKLLPATSG